MAPILQQLFHLGFIAVLSLQYLGGNVEALTRIVYQKNGVRLVGESKSQGRLEVLPRQPWATNGWVQVCDDTLTDLTAQNLCKMLGYRFGRKYYTAEVAFPVNVTHIKAGYISCYQQTNSRRLDEEMITTSTADDTITAEDPGVVHHQGRKLLAPSIGFINATSKAPFTCRFRVGTCNPLGPVAGLQCANIRKSLQPAPPPPPSPPTPPPSPPAVANYIHIIGNIIPGLDGAVEPNLCNAPNTAYTCLNYGRVEIEVNSPDTTNPEKIWAPVCNITDPLLASKVAKLACEQRYQEKKRPWLPYVWYIWASVSPTPFYIPNQAVNPDDFNPAAVKGYVNIMGGDFNNANKLQDLEYQVSTKRCDQNAMFAFSCSLASNDDAIP
ncbi:hypothetical protein Vafri_14929 [Volvox africanus]|uniref:SRCR domain-containing protein n=1 Tax=Volvox africanus TaxID=51714 RepID=A0A8J4BFU6_9CHLO|nr:hypothetical protein Vafri_14929 [Volvox africanus]